MNSKRNPLVRQGGTVAIFAALCIVCVLFFTTVSCNASNEANVESEIDDETSQNEFCVCEVVDCKVVDPEIDAYEFPIKPGTDEWYAIESIQDRFDASEIPDDVLAKISTAGLFEACLEYPFLSEISYSRDGFERMVERRNGLRELFERCDLPYVMINKYIWFNEEVENLRSLSSLEQGRFSFKNYVIEMMAARIVCNLNAEQEKELVLLALERYEKMKDYSDIFGNSHMIPTAMFFSKIILKNDLADENTKNGLILFLQDPNIVSQKEIDDNLKKYIVPKYKN